MSAGKLFLSALVAEGTIVDVLQYGNIDHLFRDHELPSWTFVKNHVKKHGAVPTAETIQNHTGEALQAHKEPASYYLELMRARRLEKRLKTAMTEASSYLSVAQKNPDKAYDLIRDMVLEMALEREGASVMDFRHAMGLIQAEYTSIYQDVSPGLKYGWPTLDTATGGIRRGDIVSLVGRPAMGKTYQLLYGARYGWDTTSKAALLAASGAGADVQTESPVPSSRLFVSMEMSTLAIQQRLAAMQASIPMDYLKHAELSTFQMKKLTTSLTEIQAFGAPFWVVDGNMTATGEDIYMLARQLKPDAIFIDGGYLVKHPTERDRFRRVAENADFFKTELAKMAPTTVSWQFARSASKKKKDEKVTGDDVGYSDAIYQNATVLMGLFQEETVETLQRRRIEILKGRHGEVGGFTTNWDFVNMDFSEVSEVDLEDLQFI